MNNLVEGIYGHGAIVTPKIEHIESFSDVAKDTAPFDWNLGYDIRNDLKVKAGINDVPTKNQNGSGSCGGQASSYLSQAKLALNSAKFTEKSAKFIYAPIAQPGGGSSEPDIIHRIVNVGVADESLCPSYENGNPPSENFMSDTSSIIPDTIQNASISKGYKPVYINIQNIDEMAQAIRDNQGIIVGLYGQNNGTWLSADPIPPSFPKGDISLWAHWLWSARAEMRSGKKKIGQKNSWGDSVGEHGWQFIGEEYLPYLFSCFSIVFMGHSDLNHVFAQDMHLGSSNPEVGFLQNALKIDGSYPIGQAITNYFGPVTLQAVKVFQAKYGVPQTGYVGPLTRGKLNIIFGGSPTPIESPLSGLIEMVKSYFSEILN